MSFEILGSTLREFTRRPLPALEKTMPHDDLGFEILNNILLFMVATKRRDINLDFNLYQHALDTLDKVCKGKPVSSRSLAEYERRVTIKILPDHKAMVMTQFKLSNVGSMARRQVTSAKCLEIRWRITDKGTVYFLFPEGSKIWYLFYAHFFDRFVERGLNTQEARHISIGKFLWQVLCRHTNLVYYEAETTALTLFCDEGAALGYVRVLTDKTETATVPCVLFKTFISRDMFSDKQREEERKAQAVLPLSYETVT